jgi:hypothetical protein
MLGKQQPKMLKWGGFVISRGTLANRTSICVKRENFIVNVVIIIAGEAGEGEDMAGAVAMNLTWCSLAGFAGCPMNGFKVLIEEMSLIVWRAICRKEISVMNRNVPVNGKRTS